MRHFVRKTEVSAVDGGFVLRLVGPVDADAAMVAGETIDILAGDVHLDFGQVPFVDEDGLKILRDVVKAPRVDLGNCPNCVATLIHGEAPKPAKPAARPPHRGSRRFPVPWGATVTAKNGSDVRWHRFAVRDAGMGGLRLEALAGIGASLVRGASATVRLQQGPLDIYPIVLEMRIVYSSATGVIGIEITENDPTMVKRYLALLAEACPEDLDRVD